MSTTTIRVEEELKARVAVAAARAGKTPHAFIVEAIEKTVAAAEEEAELHRIADERWARIASGGATVPWEAAKSQLQQRAAKAAKPTNRRR